MVGQYCIGINDTMDLEHSIIPSQAHLSPSEVHSTSLSQVYSMIPSEVHSMSPTQVHSTKP